MQLTVEQLDRMPDHAVLELARGMGPGIIGKAHFDRANEIAKRTDNGVLGPAITDPDYSKKQDAARAARKAAAAASLAEKLEDEPDEEELDQEEASEDKAWQFVTLSGAKRLAQEHGVSYAPKPKLAALVEALKLAGVKPPAPPVRPAREDDFNDLG